MKFKKISIFIALLSLSPISFADECNYNSIQGVEYELSDLSKKYVTNDFQFNPTLEDYEQSDESEYRSLIYNPFKVTRTDVITKDSDKLRGFLNKYRYEDINIDYKAYRRDKLYNVEVTTKDCKKFYYSPSLSRFSDFKSDFKRYDGTPITIQNYYDFFKGSINKIQIETSQQYDKFEKKIKVKTDFFDRYLIRGNFNILKNKYDFIQLYLQTSKSTKLNKSPYFDFNTKALDTDGNSHDITEISSEIDECKNDFLGCVIYRDMAIDLSENFLRNHQNGFELKIMDIDPYVISVSNDVVQSFLNTTNKLRRK